MYCSIDRQRGNEAGRDSKPRILYYAVLEFRDSWLPAIFLRAASEIRRCSCKPCMFRRDVQNFTWLASSAQTRVGEGPGTTGWVLGSTILDMER